MTAIAGYWSFEPGSDVRHRCDAMLAAQRRYGPDAQASGQAGSLAFGRCLYNLLSEDRHDRQPLRGSGGRLLLVADVRLDNRADLLRALAIGAGQAASLADSDIVLRAWERWQDASLDRIVGDYALAVFDAEAQTLILARDPLGQRPLFWTRGRDHVAFASMPSGLHASGVRPEADPEALARFVGSLPLSPGQSFHRNIYRVDPGHFVRIDRSGEHVRRHWRPNLSTLRLKRFDDYVSAFRETLDQAVESRLRGAGTLVASHLSGGWDSGAVTATAARLLQARGGRVAAFTAVPRAGALIEVPRNRFIDEWPLAAATAALHPNIDHVAVPNPSESPLADLATYAELFQRPMFNICNHLWLAEIRRQARSRGAHVLLTGEIGNWTISAAPVTLLADYVRERRWRDWWREARALRRVEGARLRGLAARSFGPWLPARVWRGVQHLSSAPSVSDRALLHPDYARRFAGERQARELGAHGRPSESRQQAALALAEMDFGEYRKGLLAGWGIDKRDATADRRVIEFCLSLPLEMLLSNGRRRPLARAALSDRLPSVVLDEPRKGYQAADWPEALANDRAGAAALVGAMEADPVAAAAVDTARLRSLVADWPDRDWDRADVRGRYRIGLLQALSAGSFALAAARKA